MRSELFQEAQEIQQPGMRLQNRKMLRVGLGADAHREFYARQGSMVAYQGAIDFAY